MDGRARPLMDQKVIGVSVGLSIYLSICLSVCLFVCLSVRLSVYLSICLSIYLSTCLPVRFALRATTACNLSSLISPGRFAPAALASLLFAPTHHCLRENANLDIWADAADNRFPAGSRQHHFFCLSFFLWDGDARKDKRMVKDRLRARVAL